MENTPKKDKTKLRYRPEDIIFGNDPSIDILKQIYAALKDRSIENLDISERAWVHGIEKAYKDQVKVLMEQVYEILHQKEEMWDTRDEELYSLLERVIFLKARESTFHDFFDNMENVIEAASQLDFSKRVPLSEISKDKRNLFNYAVMCLNILVEKMETSVVSMKAVNTMLSSMPGTMMIVTDKNGVIRFVNDLGEKILGLKKNEFLGKSVYLLIDDHKQISKEYSDAGELKNRKVNLITPGKNKKAVPVFLTIPKPYKDHTEIEEIVYSITIDNKLQDTQEKEFNFTQELHDKVAPLNTIIGAATVLSQRIIDKDGKKLVQAIITSAQKVKTNATDALNSINAGSSNFSEISLVDVSGLVTQILDSIKLNEGFDEMNFDVDIDYENDLFANPKLIYSILQNLISNAIKYRCKNKPSVRISVRDLSRTELLIRINDNGIGIDESAQEHLFDKSFQASDENEGHGVGLYLVKESVDRLKGSIEVHSKLKKGTTFIIRIPCSPDNKKQV